jgi:peptide subunit release factor 1 (eRF1)
MRRACHTFHNGNKVEALEHLSGLPELIEKAANKTNDSNLAKEANLVRNLIETIERETGRVTRWGNQRGDDSDSKGRARESVPSNESEKRYMTSSAGRAVRW